MAGLQTKILEILRSRTFFLAILGVFAIESVWIAISAAYPMVFDENTHFGVIQLFSHQWSPLFLHQPAHTEWAGALTRNPSYLYHYLMSFPYRLIAAFTQDQMIQIILLRFINVALFGSALVLFRRLLLKTKVSPAIVNVAILFFVLTPVVPLLAGQINYDNLVMPLVALALLLATSVSKRLSDQKQLPVGLSLGLLTLCLFSSLVKFEFLPIFAAITLWLGWQAWRLQRGGKLRLGRDLREYWQSTGWQQKLMVGAPLLVAIGLFVQMYGVNLVLYHNLTPQCHQVLSRQECAGFSPWQRNQEVLLHKTSVNINPALYLASWLYRVFVAMFFTSSGGASANAFYLSINPLPVIFGAAIFVFGLGLLLVAKYRQKLFNGYEFMGLLLFVSLFYALALWLRNYQDYVRLGEKIAIQGRYLFPIALPCMLIVALAFRQLFGHRAHLKMALLSAVFLLFLQGGGALTYITNSNENWYWQNGAVSRLNQAAQRAVKPLIIIKTPLKSFGASSRG